MKRTLSVIFATIIGLLLISPAHAVLSGNLVNNSGFDTAPTAAASGTIPTNTWYYSGSWTNQPSGGQSGAFEQMGKNGSGYIFELVSAPSGATSGPVAVQFYQIADNTTPQTAQVALYGYSSAPTFANISASGSTTGTAIQLTSGNNISNTALSPIASWTAWNSDSGATATSGYSYYLIWINGASATGGSSTGHSYGIDAISAAVSVVPIPPGVWLLATGLVGLVGIRRIRKGRHERRVPRYCQ